MRTALSIATLVAIVVAAPILHIDSLTVDGMTVTDTLPLDRLSGRWRVSCR